jgi:hypothetical protein
VGDLKWESLPRPRPPRRSRRPSRPLKPEDGDEDVLAKLVYGFFGREVTDRDKMKTFLDTGSGLRPSPDASRIVGALVLENVVAGSPPLDRGGDGPPGDDLLANGKGNRSGPWVTLLHKYREIGKGTEAWIAVDYRHLHSVAAQAGASIESGAAIGQVGSSGNSVSPHIHMAINVYDRNPRERGSKVLGFLLPLDFFPFGRKGK